MCASLAKLMITEFDPANTVAVRTYCLCPRGNGSNLCFNEDELQKNLQGFLEGKRKGPPPGPAVQRIGPLMKVTALTRLAILTAQENRSAILTLPIAE